MLGQKVNPIGLRLGVNRSWDSVWFDEKNFASRVNEDILIRHYLNRRFSRSSIANILISRKPSKTTITVSTSRPGLIIGKGGSEIEIVKKQLKKMLGYSNLQINVNEIKRPGLSAELVGQNIAQQLEKKVNYRRAVKKSIQTTMSMGAQGIRVGIAGRLNGAEIARGETFRDGRVPLHTLRADIDYALVEANTTYGIIGVKVWIFKGEIRGKRRK
ncbi:30S ribosomal protein S3 [bacterium]|nr:MAG: 30S ribosomal protein S3 [bacterium]